MKKILIIHTRYMNIGGEDIAVDNELQLLDKNYEVRFLSFKNDLSNIIPQLLSFILNIYIVFRITGFSKEEKYLKAAVERLR